MQKYEEFLEWQNLFLCVGEKGASVIMLGVALVGQHHIGRGIKGRLVQYCIGGHKVGIDIQQLVVACQFQAALTSSTLLHLGIAQASLALLSTCAKVGASGIIVESCHAALLRASENEGIKPHGFSAVYPFGFM